jgi:hypothetical protein
MTTAATTKTAAGDVLEARRKLQTTLSYAEAVERLRGCRRAVARAARALASGNAAAATALDTWWQLERAQRAVVARLRPAADEARRPTRDEFVPRQAAPVLRLRAA